MGKIIDVSGFTKREPLTIIVGDSEYTVSTPKVRQIKEAARLEKEAGDNSYDKLCAGIESLAILTGLPIDVFDDLDMEGVQTLQDAITKAIGGETEKNDESTAPVS